MQAQINKVVFKAGLDHEIEIIPIAELLVKQAQAISNPHRTAFYHIVWIQTGVAKYFIDFEPLTVRANSFVFLNKDRVQSIDHKSKHDGKVLIFTDAFFANQKEDVNYLQSNILFNDLLNVPVIDVTQSTALQTFFMAIERELSEPKDNYQYSILHNLLHNLLLGGERERRKQGFTEIKKGADLDLTISFRNNLEQHFKTLRSVAGYALQLNVSDKRLTTATTNALGNSPKKMIDERVILEGKRLLIHTNLSVKEIGYELGFDEPTYFIKYFRKHTHHTPVEFRDAYLSL